MVVAEPGVALTSSCIDMGVCPSFAAVCCRRSRSCCSLSRKRVRHSVRRWTMWPPSTVKSSPSTSWQPAHAIPAYGAVALRPTGRFPPPERERRAPIDECPELEGTPDVAEGGVGPLGGAAEGALEPTCIDSRRADREPKGLPISAGES